MKTIIALMCLVAGCYMSDENLGYTAVGTPRWAVTLGGTENDEGRAVAVDSIGDVVAGGFLDQWSSLSAGEPESDPNLWSTRGFVTKRAASDGSEKWTRTFTSSGLHADTMVGDIAIGAQNTVIAIGDYMGTVDFGGQTLTLPDDRVGVFVVALSSTGDLLWLHGLGDVAQAVSLATDAQGRVFVAGRFSNSSIQLGDDTFVDATGDGEAFLVAFDPLGAVLWGTAFQAAAPGTLDGAGPSPESIAIAGNGDVLVSGTFTAPMSFGGPLLEPQARERGFLARYRSDGAYVSSQTVGRPAPYSTFGLDIAVDPAGHIVLQHVEQNDEGSALDVGARPNVIHFLADDGTELWDAAIENHGSYGPQRRALATTPDGLIVTSSWTDAPYNADDPASVTGSMEVLAFDPNGDSGTATFGARRRGGLQQTFTWSTAVSATGMIAFTGSFSGMVDFFGTGGAPLGTHGQDDNDVYVVAVDPPVTAPTP